jgi:hypothetical protein
MEKKSEEELIEEYCKRVNVVFKSDSGLDIVQL